MGTAVSWYREFQQGAINALNRVRQLSSRDGVILSRTACLGTGVQSLLDWGHSINHQKNRADLILQKKPIASLSHVNKFLCRKDVLSLVYAQRIDLLSYKRVSAVVFDSFSELVDHEFLTPDGKRFFAVKGDVEIDALNAAGGSCNGLMDLSNLFRVYSELFSRIHERYRCRIYFINFPSKFESRSIYIERAAIIANASRAVMAKTDYFFSVEIPVEDVSRGSDDFPYHFSETTYNACAEMLSTLNCATRYKI